MRIDEFNYFLYAFKLRTMFDSERNVELLRDQLRERNKIRRGDASLNEAEIQILGHIYWLPIYFEVFADEISEAICG